MSDATIGEIEEIEREVLRLVESGEHDPSRILEHLVDRGNPDSKVRVAFWFLIGSGRLDLTPNLQFELPSRALPLAS